RADRALRRLPRMGQATRRDATPTHGRRGAVQHHVGVPRLALVPVQVQPTCDDHDGAPVKPFPPTLTDLGARACADTGFDATPFDAAIINYYSPGAKLGLHRDGSEGDDVIGRGSPVVTI